MNLEVSKKSQSYFFSLLFIFLTVSSVLSLSAFDMTGKTVVVFDGKERKNIHTRAQTFKEALSAARIQLGPHDTYWASTESIENGTVLMVERARPVTIVSGGERKEIYTTQQTVQGAVNDAGFDWQTMMPLEDGLTRIQEGMVIHVVPYTRQVVTREESLPVSYVKWYDPRMASGAMEVMDPGHPGVQAVTREEIVSEGKVLRSSVLSAEVVDEGLEGSARVGDEEGTVGRIFPMRATAYHPSDGDGRGITATGTRAGYGTVAVDPGVIPLGTTVYIPGYGEAVASDTGGAIQGNRIDLCMETFSECYNFGVQNVEVFVSH